MCIDEAKHHTRRALFELDRVLLAADDDVGRAHAQLSDLHLERARLLVGRETGIQTVDNVVPLRATA